MLLEEIGIGLGSGLECDFTLNGPTLKGLIEIVRGRYSLAHAGYLCPGFTGVNYKEPIGAVTYSDDWITHYQKENYLAVDPVVIMGAKSILPFEWRHMEIQGRRAKRLYAEAGDAGNGKQGLTIPVRGPTHGVWAIFFGTTDDSEREWELRLPELQKELFFAAYQIHQLAFQLYGNAIPKIDLNSISLREGELLQRMADGANLQDIATAMNITAGCVKSYLKNARTKLHAVSGAEAVAKAFRAGLIR